MLYHDADASVFTIARRRCELTVMRSRFALVASTALVGLVVVADRRSDVGAVFVLWFLSVAPGSALLRLVRLPDNGAAGWVTAIGASFALDALVTEAMVYAHVWTPTRGLIILGVLVVALVAAEGGTRARSRESAVDEQTQ